jgi:hypothetical protein
MAKLFLMNPEKRKELFSRAHVAAIASAAGFTFRPLDENDDDSCDAMISARGGPGPRTSPRLEIQLKSTASPQFDKDNARLRFPLKQKNYVDLIDENTSVPRILAVVVVPRLSASWVRLTEDSLILFHCCYWRSLAGLPPTDNKVSTAVEIPRSNLFTVEALTGIMLRIARGGRP